jgi:hypothetical protein
MKVELPGESKSFADITAGECFAFTRKQVTSVCMKVEWLSSASIAVLWSASDDWTVPHLIAPAELAGLILHSLPSAVFVASSDAKDVRADRTRHEYAPGFLIEAPTGQPLIAVKGLEREHGIPLSSSPWMRGGTPQRVLLAHPPDQFAQLSVNSGSPGPPARFPAPIGPKPCSMPPQDCVRLNDARQTEQPWPQPSHP